MDNLELSKKATRMMAQGDYKGGNNSAFKDTNCHICGKLFFPTSLWRYKRLENGVRHLRMFCSYNCMSMYDEKHDTHRKHRREVATLIKDLEYHKATLERSLAKAKDEEQKDKILDELMYLEEELKQYR